MRALVAFDKFKEALTARAACEAAAAAIRARHPDWEIDLCPLTDGGEGFCETLCRNLSERIKPVKVSGPRGEPVVAPVGSVSSRSLTQAARLRIALQEPANLAVVGLASASGIELLAKDRRDPWHTTTFGTGELLRHAAQEKTNAILLGIGGSATNDLGCGALAALGVRFLDATGASIPLPTPATWEHIQRIDCSHLIKLPPIFIACDVTNPLLGPTGATKTFGPQKGLFPADLPRLEEQCDRMAALLGETFNQPLPLTDTPGAGAAGGIAFGLMVAANAKLVSGFDLVSDWLNLTDRIAAADLVITGEGRFDATSLGGKGPGSLVREALQLGKSTHVFAGNVDLPAIPGLKAHAISPAGMPLAEALHRTAELLTGAIGREL